MDAGETSLIDLQLPYDSREIWKLNLWKSTVKRDQVSCLLPLSLRTRCKYDRGFHHPRLLAREVSWEIRDDEGSVVVSASMDNEPAGIPVTWVEVMPDGCYTFLLLDSFGDGLNGCHGLVTAVTPAEALR